MACVSPPEPADRDLLAYIDGEPDDRVAVHLEQCPHCRERAQHLARLQDILTAHLYRFNCPPPATLGEYHLGVLPGDRAAAVTQHLAECPRCGSEIAQLKDY
jgi:anti-sigma factor RsiW